MPDEPLTQVELEPGEVDNPQLIADKVSLKQLEVDDPIVWKLLGEPD